MSNFVMNANSAVAARLVALTEVLFGLPILKALALLIILIPFSSHELLDAQILAVPGAKPFLIISVYILLVILYHSNRSQTIPKVAVRFAWILTIVFSIAIIRSALNGTASVLDPQADVFHYLLSHYLKPLLFFLPFIVILSHVREEKEILFILQTMNMAITMLSIFFIYIYVFQLTDADRAYFELIRYYLGEPLKLEGNNIGGFYTLAFPIVLASLFRRPNMITASMTAINLTAIALLFSRGVYGAIIASSILFMFLTRRWKLLALLVVAFIFSIRFLPEIVVNRAATGISGKEIDIRIVSAGRVSGLWLPLCQELIRSPEKSLTGFGRYGMLVTDAYRAGMILPAQHPHSMYLELIVDAGLIGFIAVSVLFIKLLRYTMHNRRMDDIYAGLFVAVIAFLISSLTDHTIFPNQRNSFLWIVIACMIRVCAGSRSR